MLLQTRGALLGYLHTLLIESTATLPAVTGRRLFGCQALYATGNIFAMVWRTGRIGLRLPDPALYAELLAMDGAERWTVRDRIMSRWVLVPEAFHDEPDLLDLWVRRAYALASGLPTPAADPDD